MDKAGKGPSKPRASRKEEHRRRTWQPKPQVRQRVCFHYARTGRCVYGNRCRFLHDQPPLPTPTPSDEGQGTVSPVGVSDHAVAGQQVVSLTPNRSERNERGRSPDEGKEVVASSDGDEERDEEAEENGQEAGGDATGSSSEGDEHVRLNDFEDPIQFGPPTPIERWFHAATMSLGHDLPAPPEPWETDIRPVVADLFYDVRGLQSDRRDAPLSIHRCINDASYMEEACGWEYPGCREIHLCSSDVEVERLSVALNGLSIAVVGLTVSLAVKVIAISVPTLGIFLLQLNILEKGHSSGLAKILSAPHVLKVVWGARETLGRIVTLTGVPSTNVFDVAVVDRLMFPHGKTLTLEAMMKVLWDTRIPSVAPLLVQGMGGSFIGNAEKLPHIYKTQRQLLMKPIYGSGALLRCVFRQGDVDCLNLGPVRRLLADSVYVMAGLWTWRAECQREAAELGHRASDTLQVAASLCDASLVLAGVGGKLTAELVIAAEKKSTVMLLAREKRANPKKSNEKKDSSVSASTGSEDPKKADPSKSVLPPITAALREACRAGSRVIRRILGDSPSYSIWLCTQGALQTRSEGVHASILRNHYCVANLVPNALGSRVIDPGYVNFHPASVDLNQLQRSVDGLVIPLLTSPQQLRARHVLRERLEALICQRVSGASMCMFGSSVNNFGFPSSDVDMCMVVHDDDVDEVKTLRSVLPFLQRNGLVLREKILLAKVPLVRLLDPFSGLGIDLSVNNVCGLRNSMMFRMYSQIDDRVVPLVLTVKAWARARKVNDASQGTLSSYAYGCLVIFFLMNRPNPVLPCLQQLNPDGRPWTVGDPPLPEVHFYSKIDTYFCENMDGILRHEAFGKRRGNKETVPELLLEFFKFFALEFDFRSAVSIRLGRLVPLEELDWDRFEIGVEDPFVLSHNLGRPVMKRSFVVIHAEFVRAYRVLCDSLDVKQLCLSLSPERGLPVQKPMKSVGGGANRSGVT